MARNKSSKFGVAEDLEFQSITPAPAETGGKRTRTTKTHEAYEEQEEYEVKGRETPSPKPITEYYVPAPTREPVEYGTTQGNHDGKKMKRMTMAFSDVNYEYIRLQGRYTGKTATGYVNMLIDEDRKKHGDIL